MDSISISQLVEFCNISRRSVIYALQDLEAKRMIFIDRNFRETNKISFNKDYDSWLVQNFAPQTEKNRENARVRKQEIVQNFAPSAKLGETIVQNSVNNERSFAPTKENKTKDNKQKTEGGKLSLPEFLDKELWNEFRSHRIALKSKMTPYAERRLFKKLKDFLDDGYSPEQVIGQSIEKGWKGLFEPKEDTVSHPKNNCHIQGVGRIQ